jgi:uncharacterized protein YutE (UPF0331/DUF86 family)
VTPEQEIIEDLLAQANRVRDSLPATLSMISTFPDTVEAFEAMPATARIGTTAMLKQFEQLEDSLAGLFRAVLRTMGQRLKGLYPLDIGNKMIELDVLDDSEAWLAVVKLRNQLVHEYSLVAAERFERLSQAYHALPLLIDALARIEKCIAERQLLEDRA